MGDFRVEIFFDITTDSGGYTLIRSDFSLGNPWLSLMIYTSSCDITIHGS